MPSTSCFAPNRRKLIAACRPVPLRSPPAERSVIRKQFESRRPGTEPPTRSNAPRANAHRQRGAPANHRRKPGPAAVAATRAFPRRAERLKPSPPGSGLPAAGLRSCVGRALGACGGHRPSSQHHPHPPPYGNHGLAAHLHRGVRSRRTRRANVRPGPHVVTPPARRRGPDRLRRRLRRKVAIRFPKPEGRWGFGKRIAVRKGRRCLSSPSP